MPPINPTGPGLNDYSPSKFFLDSKTSPAAPTSALEEDGDWWSSIEKFGTRVAIATALVATSLSTAVAAQPFQQDELPRSSVIDDTNWVPPRPVPVTLRIWALQGQGGAVSSSYQLEEENYSPASIIPYVVITRPQWTYDVQELSPTWLGEEYYLSPTVIQPLFQFPQQYSFDSSEFVLSFVPIEEYNWPTPLPRSVTPRIWSLQGQGSAAFVSEGFVPNEEYDWPVVPLPKPIIPRIWALQGQGSCSSTESATISFDEQGLVVAPPPEPVTTVLQFLDDGEVIFSQMDEQYPWPIHLPKQFIPRIGALQGQGSCAFSVSETFTPNEEYDWPVPIPKPVIPRIWALQGQGSAASSDVVTPISFEEQGIILAPPPEPVTTVLLFLDDGELVFSQIDEDYWQKPVPVAPYMYPGIPQWSYGDIELPAAVVVPSEDYWLQPAPVVSTSYPISAQYSYDDASIGTQKAVHEEYWQNHYPLIPSLITMTPPYAYDPMDIVPQPAEHQNYVDPGVHNYVSQELGTGVKF